MMQQLKSVSETLDRLIEFIELLFGCFPREAMLLSEVCKGLQTYSAWLSRNNPMVARARSYNFARNDHGMPSATIPAFIQTMILNRGFVGSLRVSTGPHLTSAVNAQEFAKNVNVLDLIISSSKHVCNLEPFTSVRTLTVKLQATHVCPKIHRMGLGALTNLIELNLRFLGITDITALAEVPGLKSLSLAHNKIVDISSLAKISGLEVLFLNGNHTLADVSALSGLVNMALLDLSWTDVKDLEPLSGLVLLKNLELLNCTRVHDLSPLSGLTRLWKLRLSHSLVADLTPIGRFTSLTYLELSHMRGVTTLSPLLRLNKLSSLILEKTVCKTSDAATHANLTALYRLPEMRFIKMPNGEFRSTYAILGRQRT